MIIRSCVRNLVFLLHKNNRRFSYRQFRFDPYREFLGTNNIDINQETFYFIVNKIIPNKGYEKYKRKVQ